MNQHLIRCLHMAAALFNLAYVYTPLHQWPTYPFSL